MQGAMMKILNLLIYIS